MTPLPPSPHPSLATALLPDAVERLAASVVSLSMRRGAASGVVWHSGVVVTAASAVWRASRLAVVLPDGEQVEGTLRGADAGTDLAAVTFEGGNVPAVQPSQAAQPRVGDFVFAVGREASGLVQASFGHVGAVAGEWRSWRGGRVEQLIRLDGGLYPGLAGAPVADAGGQAIGIASPAFSRQHGVVLPVSTITRVLAQLLEHGRVHQGYLGIAAQPVRAVLGGAGVDGLLISSVADDAPAAKAGLLVGDVIVSVGGQPVAGIDQLRDALGTAPLGASLPLKVARGGQAVDLTVDVAERPRRHCH